MKMSKYQVEIQYVEATITYVVDANSENEAAQLGTECFVATCTGIEDGRVQPGDEIPGDEIDSNSIGRFVSYKHEPSLGGPVVTLIGKR
jgi:hypothetical protein